MGVRIVLAMRGGLLRGALRYVLSADPEIDVVAEHETIDDTIGAIAVDRQDVTVVDLNLLGVDGATLDATQVAERTQHELPGCKVLVLVDPRRPGFGSQLAGTPATVGFLAQTAPPERVVDALLRLCRGERVVDVDLLVAALTPTGPLTNKELRVLQIAALGWTVKEIAAKLSLSPGTVSNHLSRIMNKVGARNRIEAIHIAQSNGWI